MILPYRAVALDIDGTLIDSSKRIMPFTRDEIARVASLGAHVFLVTARGPESTSVIEERLGVASSYACYGGALVQVRGGGERDAGSAGVGTADLAGADAGTVRAGAGAGSAASTSPAGGGALAGRRSDLLAEPMPAEIVRRVLDAAGGRDLHVGVYTRDRWIIEELDYFGLREARNTAVWPVVADFDGFTWAGEDGVFKIMVRGEVEPLAAVHDALSTLSGDVYAHSNGRILEISARTAVKRPAVELLCRHHGIRPDEIVAFGDAESDLEMLGSVGFGVLMGNASASLDVPPGVHRTLSNDEDGVGVMLRRCFPTGEAFRP